MAGFVWAYELCVGLRFEMKMEKGFQAVSALFWDLS